MIEQTQLEAVGTLQKVHGTRGEIYCALLSDLLFEADIDWLILQLNGTFVPFRLLAVRPKADGALLSLEDVDTAQKALQLCGCQVFVNKEDLPDDYQSTLSVDSLVGYEVVNEENRVLGKITDIDDSTLNLLVQLSSGLVFPWHEDFIIDLNESEHRIRVALPEGLLSL